MKRRTIRTGTRIKFESKSNLESELNRVELGIWYRVRCDHTNFQNQSIGKISEIGTMLSERIRKGNWREEVKVSGRAKSISPLSSFGLAFAALSMLSGTPGKAYLTLGKACLTLFGAPGKAYQSWWQIGILSTEMPESYPQIGYPL